MRRLTNLIAAARADLAGVPRKVWLGLGLVVVLELAAAVVLLRFLH